MDHQALIARMCRWLMITAAGCLCSPSFGSLPVMPEPLENVVLPDKPGVHWVWVSDSQWGGYARSILYDADSGDILGMIDTGWEGIGLNFPRSGNEVYNLAMFMSRGYRGDRTDVVTTFDRRTLKPLREVIVPPKSIKGLPDPNHTALSDDDRFMFMQFFTPASSVGVVDLLANKFIGEIETSGCAHVMAAGTRRIFALCGDGSALVVTIGEDGKEESRKRTTPFFDPDKDPIHGCGTRVGNEWYFASHRGQIYEVDVSGPELVFPPKWSIAETEKGLTWVPGPPMEAVAIHIAKRRLYVLMHASDLKPKGGGNDFHREEATEAWVFDLNTKRRLKRVHLKMPTSSLSVSQDSSPLIYGGSVYGGAVTVYDEATGQPLRAVSIPLAPTLIQPVQ